MHRIYLFLAGLLPVLGFGQSNIGVNISAPLFKMDVRGSTPDDPSILQLATPSMDHFVRVFAGRPGDPNPFVQWKDGDPLRFATDAGGFAERMRLTSEGRLGIGTLSPASLVHIYHSVNASVTLETPFYNDTTGIRLMNGPNPGPHSHYFLENRSDQLRIRVETDLGGGTSEELLRLTYTGNLVLDGTVTSEALAGIGTRPLGTSSSGELVVMDEIVTFVSVAPCAFKPENNSNDYEADQAFVHGASGTDRLYAPIALPHGTTIKEFFVQYRDQSSNNMTVSLKRKNLINSNATLNTFTTSGTPNVSSYTSSEMFSVVDNENFVYYVEMYPSTGSSWDGGFLGVYSVRVKVQ